MDHKRLVDQQLKEAGISSLGRVRSEGRYLHKVIHKNETIGGAVIGTNHGNSVMLVATNRRVIYLDKKPMFFDEEEIRYDVVSGVSLSHSGIGSTLTLHTRVKDYKIKTVNKTAANKFVAFIEQRALERENGDRT